MANNGPDYASDFTTLVDLVKALETDGYTGQFIPREGGKVKCAGCGQEVDAADVEIHVLRRTEGASDPDDMMVVAGLVCPACGCKGTVVLKYGPEASLEDVEVLRQLEDHRPRR